MSYLPEFDSRVCGIPCIVKVVYYHPGSEAVHSGPLCGPEEPPEIDYVILDRNGRRAQWLERKMTKSDHDDVYEEALEACVG